MEGQGSFIAALALGLFVPASLALFAFFRAGTAVALCFIFGTILLPEQMVYYVKVFPNIDKMNVISLCALLGCLVTARHRIRRALRGKLKYLFLLLFANDVLRALMNGDALHYGSTVLGGIKPHTGLTFVLEDTLRIGVPFVLGAAVFRRPTEIRNFVRIFVAGAILYSLFALIEIRLSPQLHKWVYGYQHIDFAQVLRGDGYRPVAFFPHGLAAAMFLATALTLTLALYKSGSIYALILSGFFMLVLILSHSLGALLYGIALAPVILLSFPRSQARAAKWIAIIVLVYPALRVADVFPMKWVVDKAAMINEDRASSLQFRFTHDDAILKKTMTRPVFGWGGFARGRIFDEQTGEDLSVTDGEWILVVMKRGVSGFLCFFSILLWPVIRAAKRLRHVESYPVRALLAGLALAGAINSVDLLVNALFTVLPFLIVGALYGALQELAPARSQVPAQVPPYPRRGFARLYQ